MKLTIIVTGDGVIVGTAPVTPKLEGDDAPAAVRLVPAAGRTVQKLDVPKDVATLRFDDLRRRYRVSLRGGAKLVAIRERKAPVAAPSHEAKPPRERKPARGAKKK
jgi:hypothetical protein